jgi:ABC-2 type transport system permease protein
MHFRASYAIFLRYWYLLMSTPQRLIQVFIWSVFDIVLWGLVTKYLNTFASAEFNFTTVLLGSLLFWQFITRIQQGYIMVFLEDSWTRNFLNVFASPIRISEYVAGIVASSAFTSAVAISFAAVVSALAFGLTLPPLIVPFIVISLILVIFAITLGILSTTIILRLGSSAEWFAWPVPAVIQPLVGVFYPISVLPGWAQAVALVLPPTYVFESLREALAGGPIAWEGLAVGLGLSLLYLTIAAWIFMRTYRWAIRAGAISRFGSESF